MWPFSKNLDEVLFKPKTVRVHGVKFLIKKIDITNYLDGSKVMLQVFDTYKAGGNVPSQDPKIEKIKEHYRDVFMASVQEPKLTRKQGVKGELFVDHLFTEWDLAHRLYSHIIEYTYGKKNSTQSDLVEKSSQI
jgi:hypothetical protein